MPTFWNDGTFWSDGSFWADGDEVWPGTLPVRLSVRNSRWNSAGIRTVDVVEVGRPMARVRSSNGSRPIFGQMMLTLAQVGFLEDFYVTTLNFGGLSFTGIIDPLTNAGNVAMKFRSQPRIRAATRASYDAQLSLVTV